MTIAIHRHNDTNDVELNHETSNQNRSIEFGTETIPVVSVEQRAVAWGTAANKLPNQLKGIQPVVVMVPKTQPSRANTCA